MTDSSIKFEQNRIADEDIYLFENRTEEPKEVFKLYARLIGELELPDRFSVLDVGCSTGELISYLKTVFADTAFTGFDVSDKLLQVAKTRNPSSEFIKGNLHETNKHLKETCDVCIVSNVMCCLDDPLPTMKNVLEWTRSGGFVFILDAFNEESIDVVMRYRRANAVDSPWESGWNVFARESIERILNNSGFELDWTWIPFRMPFALDKRRDPMRTWTIRTESDPFQLINGAKQLVDLSVLKISKT